MIVFDLRDYSEDDGRDYAEERYWRDYCPGCDTSPCQGLCQGE